MTDLAAPLLYVFEGDPVKSFWCFVGLLNLTKKNFEMEQTTVKNLLIKLFKLVNLTDPCFAEFLGNCLSNCFFKLPLQLQSMLLYAQSQPSYYPD